MTRKQDTLVTMILFFVAIIAILGYCLYSQGGTFGHRCAKVYSYPSGDYNACVKRLAAGGEIK